MNRYRFYQPTLGQEIYFLSPEESHHAVRVMRLQEGDFMEVVDGLGRMAQARLKTVDHQCCQFTVEGWVREDQPNATLHIGMAPPKNIDRFEWFLEKATETGVHEITPVICERSERKKLRMDRLQKILISAMKQSQRLYIPKLNEPVVFDQFISGLSDHPLFMAHASKQFKPEGMLRDQLKEGISATVLIGPEGDFTLREIELAKQQNAKLVYLGPRRLRTETAGLVATVCFSLLNDQMD